MDAPAQLYRLPQVLAILQISKSLWWKGVKEGFYPQPVKIGPRTTAWRVREIHELAENGVQKVDQK